MATAYDAILKNLAGAAEIRANTSHLQVVNQQYLSQMKMDYLKSLTAQSNPVASPVASNPTRDLAMSVMDKITPAADVTFAQPKSSSSHGLGGFLKSAAKFVPFLEPTAAVAKDIVTSGPGKAAISILNRPGQAVGGLYNYNTQHPQTKGIGGLSGFLDLGGLKAGWDGLTNKTHILPGDVLKSQIGLSHPTSTVGKVAAFATGLGGDIALDPTSYIPGGAIKDAIKAKIALPIDKWQLADEFKNAAPAVEAAKIAPELSDQLPALVHGQDIDKTGGNVLKSQAAQFLDKYYKPVPEAVGKEIEPFKAPRFAASTTGIADSKNPVELAHQAVAGQIADAVTSAPKLLHPGLDIESPFKTTVNETTERVPKVIQQEVPVVEKKAAVAKAASAIDAKTGKFRAVKFMLLQSPDHKLPNGITIGHLLEAAKSANESKLKDIKSLIHQEAVRVFNKQDWDSLEPVARLRGRSGKVTNAGLTLDQATHLFTHAKVPHIKNYDAASEKFADQFPLASVDDLKNLHVTNSSGDVVPIGDYLKDYNMPVHSVAPDGTIKSVIVPKSVGQDAGEVAKLADKPATKMVSKTVYENVTKQTTSVARLKGAEALAWQIKHSKDLTPEELKYISHPSLKPAAFESRVAELKIKQVAGNYKTLNEFVTAAKNGEIPDDFLKQLYDQVGVRSLNDLEQKATAIIKKTGPAKVEKAPATLDDFVKQTENKTESAWDKMHKGVETPAQIIDRVATQGPDVLAKAHPELSPQMQQDVGKALRDALTKNIKTPQDATAYGYKSKTGTLRTAETLREGVGRNLKGWNAFSQGDALSSLINSSSARLKASAAQLEGKAKAAHWRGRAEAMYNLVMPELRAVENELGDRGVKIIAGKDESGILMSSADVLESLPRETVKKYLFAPPLAKAATARPTGIINAAEPLVTAALHDGNITLAKEAAYQALLDPKTGGNFAAHGASGLAAARALVKDLVDNMPTLLQRVNENYAEHSIKVGQSVTSMTDEVVNHITQLVADPAVSVPDAFSALMDRQAELQRAGEALAAPGEALPIAKVLADTGLAAKGIQPGDLAEANLAKKIAVKDAKTIFNTGVLQEKSRIAEAATLTHDMGEEVTSITDLMNLKVEAGLFRSYVPLMQKVSAFGEHLGTSFKTDYGMPDLHDSLWGSRNTNLAMGRAHRSLMSEISRYVAQTAGPAARAYEQQAFKLLQQGGEVTDPAMTPIMNAMKDSIDLMFTAGDNKNASLAIRNGLFADHINDVLDFYGAPKSMRFDPGVAMVDQANVWKSWENIDDPLDALDKAFAGYQFALTDATVGRTFTEQFGSAVAKPGFVKLEDRFNKSILMKFIDKDLYYDSEIAKQIPYYDSMRKASITGIKNKNVAYAVRLYDTFIHGIKTGLTVIRPGHHINNAMGDVILNYLAGVQNPLSYRRALRVLSGRSKMYSNWDGLKALHEDKAAFGAIPGKTIKVGQGRGNMTDDEVWRAAYNQGLLGDFHQIQDLDYNDAQQFTKLTGTTNLLKQAGHGYLAVAGKTADIINHNIRIAHFIDALGKSSAKSLNDAIDQAGAEVRKWHPDGSDLTSFEKKYAKRVILFYSWLKKSTPLIAQSMLERPGRVLTMPKATYNFAQVMGMNPDSLSDPFPQDHLYPSFLSDNILGPEFEVAGHALGATFPGDPISGTVDQTMNHPLQSLLSGLTPVAKDPIELATGKNLGTGVPIGSKSQYFDQQIPLASTIAGITGHSVAGAGASTKAGPNNLALLNFLTGAGVTDYSKPSYRKDAIYELRDKYKQAALKGRK